MTTSGTKRLLGRGIVPTAMLLIGTFAFAMNPIDLHAAWLVSHAGEPALPSGITMGHAISIQDETYLRENMAWLHDRLPDWWQYVAASQPFTLDVETVEQSRGHAAITQCCDGQGIGRITFGLPFAELTSSADPDVQSADARKITFLGVLIHEATHVQDRRAGRFPIKADRTSCIAAERSGLQKQLEFKQDAANRAFAHDATVTERFQHVLQQQIQSETHDLHDRTFWDLYCGAFEH